MEGKNLVLIKEVLSVEFHKYGSFTKFFANIDSKLKLLFEETFDDLMTPSNNI